MKKFLFSVAACVLAVSASAQGLFEKYERKLTDPRSYVCYRAAAPIVVDGLLNESSWRKAEATETFVDISGAGFAKPKYDTRAKMLWDDDYLYVSAVLDEENIIAKLSQRDTIIYHDNDFEVFLDPDGDGRNYFEIEMNARGVVFDLLLDRPYRCGGNFLIQWDCPGLKTAVSHNGTLNDPSDKDKSWSVEMAIPHKALTVNFSNPLVAGNTWRINFSRVQWLKKPEENWVWSPTGRIDMHMPDRWGYLYLSPKTVGQGTDRMVYPYDRGVYKLLWAMFYAQLDHFGQKGAYLPDVASFKLTPAEMKVLPAGAKIAVDASRSTYQMSITVPSEKKAYVLDYEGRFRVEEIKN